MRTGLLALALLGCGEPGDGPSDGSDGAPGALVAEAGEAVVATVGEPVTFDAGGSEGVGLTWTFGDGTTAEAAVGEAVTHTYDEAGHFTAFVEVADAEGRTTTDSVPVTVHHPLLPVRPRRSSSLVGAQGRVFVALPDFGAVAVVDAASGTVLEHWTPCPSPRRLALDPTSTRLAVACDVGAPAVVVLDRTDGAERGRLALSGDGVSPFGVVYDDDGGLWATARERASEDGLLLDLSADATWEDTLRFGHDLRGLTAGDGAVWVSQHRSPDDGGRVWRLDPPTTDLESFVLPLDPGPDSDTNSRGVPTYLEPLALRPDGRTLAVGGQTSNLERGSFLDGQPLTPDTTTRAELRQLAVVAEEGAVGEATGSARLDDRDLVGAVAWSPLGDWLYVVTVGMQTLDVVDGFTLAPAGSTFQVGHAPDGLWMDEDGTHLWVHARWSRELVRLPVDGPTVSPADLAVDLIPPGGEVLPDAVVRGAQVFHAAHDRRMSKDGYASCASCHLDGEHDGRTWDFTSRGEGLRNTISLAGMAHRVGQPIHWSSNFDEVQDFEHDIRGPQAGHGYLPDALFEGPAGTTLGDPKAGLSPELDDLAAYVNQLVPPDVPWTPDPDALAEGEALFHDPAVGCADCHPDGGSDGAWLADGSPVVHDVGTLTEGTGQRLGGPLTGLDAPDLRGVWHSGPWLHDGRATSLLEVLTVHNPDDAHGVTTPLSDDALDALVVYLRSL